VQLRSLILVVPGLLAPFHFSAAQERDTTRQARRDSAVAQLQPVQVIGSVLHAAGPLVGSGVPARVSILTAAQLREWEPHLLSDALARQPGISLYDDLGSPSKMTLVARGFTASPVVGLPQGISVFLDGVPVNEPDAGQVNFDMLPLEHITRVEHLSGTASLLGPHSLGGAVNLMTRHDDRASGEIELSAGSHERYSATLAHGGPIGRGWSYYAGGGWSDERGWRQLTNARRSHGLLNIGRLGQRGGARLQLFTVDGYSQTAGSLPLSVYSTKPDSNLSSGDFEDIGQVHIALSGYAHALGGSGSAMMFYRQSDAERYNVNQIDDPDVRSFSENRSAGATIDWRAARPLGAASLGLRIGAGGSANNSRIRIHAERIDPGLTTDVESPIAKLDAYSLVDLVVERVTLTAGARYDVIRVPFRNRLDSARDTTSIYRRLNPRGGVSIALGTGATIHASAGQSFRAPALIELACADPEEPCPLPFALGDDPPLDPVVATTYEAGSRWSRGALELEASAYRTDVRDDIFLFPYEDESAPSGSSIDGFFANIAGTRREGMELSSRGAIGRVDLFANYAWTRATFQADGIEIFSIREEAGGENQVERGDRLPLIPEHTAALGTSVSLPRSVTLGLSGRYTGGRLLRGDEANVERPLDAYWLLDFRAGVAVRSWEVTGLVRNVLDTRRATFGTFNFNQGAGDTLERFLTPGAPRTFELVVRRRIGNSASTRGDNSGAP
jgi:outer membrane cobalamin receptor